MKAFKKVLFVIVAAVLVVTFCLVGGSSGTVNSAAVANGEPISEQKVTNYIESFRSYAGYTDDDSWASFLVTYGYSASDLRDQVINQYARQIVVNQEAKKQGITVTSDEVSDEVDSLREQYGLTDDDAWDDALSQMGYSERQYREEVIEPNLIQNKLLEKEVGTPTLSDSDLQTYISMFGSYYSTDSWSAPTDGSTVDLSTIPSDILEQIRSDATSYVYEMQCESYLKDLYESMTLEIKPMPDGLPYDVDTSNASSMNNLGSVTISNSSSDSSTDTSTDSGSSTSSSSSTGTSSGN